MVVLLQTCTSLDMQNTNCTVSFLSTYAVCCWKPNQTSFREPTVIVSSLEITNYRTLAGNICRNFHYFFSYHEGPRHEVGAIQCKSIEAVGPRLVDLATGLLDSVLTLPNGQKTEFWEEIQNTWTEEMLSILLVKKFGGLVKKTFRLIHACYSLPVGQAIKVTLVTQVFYDNV